MLKIIESKNLNVSNKTIILICYTNVYSGTSDDLGYLFVHPSYAVFVATGRRSRR